MSDNTTPHKAVEYDDNIKKTGFDTYEVFWMSHMQCGFYAVKSNLINNH